MRPGVPCAVVDATKDLAGRCAGGMPGDDAYRAVTMSRDEEIEAYFDQPIAPGSLRLGSACNQGSVRVETIDDGGACTGTVPGVLVTRERGFRFSPAHPWSPGQRYRITLNAGNDDGCDADEICGRNGRALNTDPLSGMEAGKGGGPALRVEVEVADGSGTYMPTSIVPYADINGSGFIENGEVLTQVNRAAVRLIDTTGIVTSASIAGPDCLPQTPEVEACLYLSGTLPVVVEPAVENCTISTATGTRVVDRCVPATISPKAISATSIRMDANLVGIGLIDNLPTGKAIIRSRETAGEPIRAYIVEDSGSPRLFVELDAYLDAPDLSVPLAKHDVISKPFSVHLEGPVSFLPDGRVAISLSNPKDLDLTIGVSALSFGVGTIKLRMPAGELKLQVASPSVRGGER
jgi:hypothetical protein